MAGCTDDEKLRRIRINSLGSLFYFTSVCLKGHRNRLTAALHAPICSSLERTFIKDVYEIPRDHFKSTLCSEALPIWNSLPFTPREEDAFQKLGYPDEYIRFMHSVHSPLRRTLLVSENITNAAKLGRRIRFHFESNALFRGTFYDIIPTSASTWTNYSLTINRKPFGDHGHGEGTFDFLGVGGALQSRHYDAVVQDDIVGRKAIESPAVMEDTIEYHRLVVGAFDSQDAEHDNSEIVVGNRWSYRDLNSYIREKEMWFTFHSHSAMGGCCSAHPIDTPIFPEEFSWEKLMRLKARLGNYHFSCQYLNNPVPPEDADFSKDHLNYFTFKRAADNRIMVVHDPKDGIVRKDLYLGHFSISMAVDPTHSGNTGAGRCRHAIVVLARHDDGENRGSDYYLLETWAQACSLSTFVDKIYEIADRWKIRKFGVETSAGQVYLKFHLDQKNLVSNKKLDIVPLRGEVEHPDGTITTKKEWRIRNVLSPILEQGHFFVQRKHQDFITELETFPHGTYCDQLDALAYVPQMLRSTMDYSLHILLQAKNQQRATQVNKPYSWGNLLRVK